MNSMFSREDTKSIKGIAVVMMLLHHLAGFDDRYPIGFDGFNPFGFFEDDYLGNLARNSKLCVTIFFFLGGYGMYKRMEKGKYSLYDSIVKLLKNYWKVFAIFVPIAFIFFKRSGEGINELCTRYDSIYSREIITILISNFLTLSDSINSEWWFIQTYIFAMLLGTVYFIATKKNKNFVIELLVIFTIDVFIRSFFPALQSVEEFSILADNFYYRRIFTINNLASCFFAGITFAKFDGIIKIKQQLSQIPCSTIISFFAAIAVMWCRSFVIGDELDIVYSIAFIASVSNFFDSIKPIKKIFCYLGKHSTNIWLIHTFFCYYFLEATKIVYCTRNVFIDLLILLAMSLLSSIIIEFIFNKLSILYEADKQKVLKKDKK